MDFTPISARLGAYAAHISWEMGKYSAENSRRYRAYVASIGRNAATIPRECRSHWAKNHGYGASIRRVFCGNIARSSDFSPGFFVENRAVFHILLVEKPCFLQAGCGQSTDAYCTGRSILSIKSAMHPSSQWHRWRSTMALTSSMALAGQAERSASRSMGRSFS